MKRYRQKPEDNLDDILSKIDKHCDKIEHQRGRVHYYPALDKNNARHTTNYFKRVMRRISQRR